MRRNKLFNKSFDKSKYDCVELIDKLLEQISFSEDNIRDHLKKIRIDFPNLTDHSLDHSLKLWDYASLIIGKNKELNPFEAYILHMCFLIHDAGMCFSILDNKSDIEKTDMYKDYVALNSKMDNVEYEALFYCVRESHGDFAENIASYKLSSGKRVIEDENLRDEFASIIGKISKSHSCNISYIENELITYTSPAYMDLPIDCKKIAFILRCSDAAHIDNLRTPLTLREIETKIDGISKDHWRFQKKIGVPNLKNGYLEYFSTTSFSIEQKRAWWLCFDALRVIDNELKKAEMFFLENNEVGFEAKGVKGVDSTLVLGEKYIKTDGWKSIDTKIKASDPRSLTTNIGGKKLYGTTYIAIREVLQNSFDAISLRKIKEKDFEGKINVTLKFIDDYYILEIKDNGIGMSKSILCNQLLDFGNSYWKSNDFFNEYIGLARQPFNNIGKYGIGFFSVFMLGQYIEVSSLKFGENINNRYTLIFENGLYENPYLMEGKSLRIDDAFGTTIKIRLDKNPYETNGFIKELNSKENSLYELIRFLVPSPLCNIQIDELGKISCINKNIINDAKQYNFKEIIDIFHVPTHGGNDHLIAKARLQEIHLHPILKEGEVIGQLGLIPKITKIGIQNTCLVISNGVKVSYLGGGLIGYIKVKEITNLLRSEFEAEIPFDSIYKWGVDYLTYMKSKQDKYDYEEIIKELEFSLGLYNKDKSIGFYIDSIGQMGFISEDNLKSILLKQDEFIYYDLFHGFQEGYEYNGFFPSLRGLSYLPNIVSKKELGNVFHLTNYLEKIISEVWGSFSVYSSSGWDDFASEMEKYSSNNFPYANKTVYKKEKL
ncbi:TPA: hypothetical protein I9Y90_003320 [Elizabethkingia anophelis]|nr:hypothetical protein [Elizabethkingia anophelis]HAT4012973.1 hypothetical protein [Elizabethkingia anophelis]